MCEFIFLSPPNVDFFLAVFAVLNLFALLSQVPGVGACVWRRVI